MAVVAIDVNDVRTPPFLLVGGGFGVGCVLTHHPDGDIPPRGLSLREGIRLAGVPRRCANRLCKDHHRLPGEPIMSARQLWHVVFRTPRDDLERRYAVSDKRGDGHRDARERTARDSCRAVTFSCEECPDKTTPSGWCVKTHPTPRRAAQTEPRVLPTSLPGRYDIGELSIPPTPQTTEATTSEHRSLPRPCTSRSRLRRPLPAARPRNP